MIVIACEKQPNLSFILILMSEMYTRKKYPIPDETKSSKTFLVKI